MLNMQLKGPMMRRLADLQSLTAPAAMRTRQLDQYVRRQWAVDIINRSGRAANGIEITIEGLTADDVYRAFYLNRTGTPRILHGARNSVIIRFESEWNDSLLEVNQHCREQYRKSGGKATYTWDICLYGARGPERCGLELSTIELTASYRWLTQADNTAERRDPDLVWVPAH